MTKHALSGVEGVVENMPDRVYHADKTTLSSSGARSILKSPALFRHQQDNPGAYNPVFNLGHAAHTAILSAGADVQRLEWDSYRSKDARAERDSLLDAGITPLLPKEWEQVADMHLACLDHPVVGPLITRTDLVREASLFWQDAATGVPCRARPDLATADWSLLIDYKTTVDASPAGFAKSLGNFWYHCQQAWYMDAVKHFTGRDPAFVFIAQEKNPPYLVGVYVVDQTAIELADAMNRKARLTWRRCTETDDWPGYTPEPTVVPLPVWSEKTLTEEYIDNE